MPNITLNENTKDLKDYKELKINKVIIDGKEHSGNIITAEETKGKQNVNVTVYTQKSAFVAKKKHVFAKKAKGGNWLYELFQKIIVHFKRL